jgi:hypothetical protein
MFELKLLIVARVTNYGWSTSEARVPATREPECSEGVPLLDLETYRV